MSGASDPADGQYQGSGASAVDATPGVDARTSTVLDADVRISDPKTGPRAHRALLDSGLAECLLEALAELPGERIGDYRAVLEDAGVDAIDGLWTDAAATAAAAIDVADELGVDVDRVDDVDEAPGDEPIAELLELARSIGHGGTPVAIPSSRADLASGTPPLFANAETTPTIVVEISGAWFDRDRQQREDVLELLLELGLGCRVVIDATTLAARHLYQKHRDILPAHVTERLNPRRTPGAHVTDGTPQRVEEAVESARESLNPDGAKSAVLRALRDAQGDAMSYAELESELRLEGSYPRVLAKRLEELGLAERLERTDGRTVVSLLPAGQTLLDEWRASVGEQTRLSSAVDADSDGDRTSRGRYAPPKNHLPCRVGPRKVGRSPQGSASRTADEAADATSQDRTDRYAHGPVDLGWMDRTRHAAVAGSARSGEVSLVNAELAPMLEHCGDGREPAWSYDDREDVLVVGAEYFNPMQWWIAIARAMASPRTWRRVLGADRVGDELQDLATDDVELLRKARCIGWLPDEAAENYDELADKFADAYEELLELSARLNAEDYDDREAFRGEVQKYALGLAGTMSHLLDLAGVEVVRELRIPSFSDKFSKGGHTSQRNDLKLTVALGAAIQSRYGHHAAYRQLLEDRPEKIEQALDPVVDVDDPLAELHGSFVIAGHGVEDLESELRRTIENPKEIRADAPEIAAKIPVRAGDSPTSTRRVARAMGAAKNIDVGRRCVRALHGFCRSPYAVSAAMGNLAKESLRREMFLDELRVAIGALEDDRLLTHGSRAARSGLLALLRSEEPISQAELARRAEISTQSWRNHRDVLEAAGLVEETADGWRATIPFASERYEDDVDVAEPWILDVETDRLPGGPSTRSTVDVLEELTSTLGAWGDPTVEAALGWPIEERPPPDEALEAMGAGILRRFVAAHAPDRGEIAAPAALLGPELEQLSLFEATT